MFSLHSREMMRRKCLIALSMKKFVIPSSSVRMPWLSWEGWVDFSFELPVLTLSNTRWPLLWKTGKYRGIWQFSGKCQEKVQYDLFCRSCHKGHCLSHLYMVKLRPSAAMRLRTRGHDYELQLLSMSSTNETSLFAPFSSLSWFIVTLQVSLF